MTETNPSMKDTTTLNSMAMRAWEAANADFYHPPLPEPIIEHDPGKASYFYIDPESWTVHLNTFGVPTWLSSNDSLSFLISICQHEIQHYLVCPYDGVTNGMMFASAREHVDDALAMFACNIFADIVVDTALLNRFPDETSMRIKNSIIDSSKRMKEHSEIWRIVVATYNAAWNFPIPPAIQISDEILTAGEKIAACASEYHSENQWPRAAGKIAEILAELQNQNKALLPKDRKSAGKGNIILLPSDLDAIMGSPVENRTGDRARRCMQSENKFGDEKDLERLALEVERRGGNYRDLEGVYILAGAGTKGGDWLRFLYRAKARNRVQFQVSSSIRTGSIPLSQKIWRLGDPIEELDLVQSLQAFPVIVPNMSTRKWMKSQTQSMKDSIALPDLLIVLDSSGSMTWSFGRNGISGAFHLALMSAFASIDFVLHKGKQIGVINFSGSSRICDWTRNRGKIETALTSYQGSGTVMPVRDIKAMCREANSDNMVLVITDAEISNWNPFVKTIKTLSRKGHHFIVFHIGTSRKKKIHEKMENAGAIVIPVESPDDLFDLVVRKVQGIYSN